MDSSGANVLEIPEGDPSTYCRLCLSLAAHSREVIDSQSNFVHVIWYQLKIQLVEPDDFPCALCGTCVEKLEELVEWNSAGLLDKWGDEGLLEYKESCRAVDVAIRKSRSTSAHGNSLSDNPAQGTKTVVLPFQQLNDGRYRCNDCTNVIFDEITACIRHYRQYHEQQRNSSLAELSVGSSASRQTFKCVKCAERFDNVDEMTTHLQAHLAPLQKRTAKKRTSVVANNGGHSPPKSPAINGKKPYLKCVNCTETFIDVDELINHRVTVHAITLPKKKTTTRKSFIVSPYSTMCKACQVEFPDKKALYMHINRDHDQNICHICDRSFNDADKLVKHVSFHRNLNDIINPFLLAKHSFHCKVCFKKFRSEGEIRLHFEMKHANAEDDTEAIPTPPSSTGLQITCTGCLMAFGSDVQFEQHQLVCVAQVSAVSTMAQSSVVEIE